MVFLKTKINLLIFLLNIYKRFLIDSVLLYHIITLYFKIIALPCKNQCYL